MSDINNHFHLVGVYKTFHPTGAECTFFASAHRNKSQNLKGIQAIQCILPEHNGIMIEKVIKNPKHLETK